MKIAVLSDTHFRADREASIGARRAGLADLLLLRTVHRLKRLVRPDLVLVLGDLIDEGDGPEATDLLLRLRDILELLDCPVMVLPGNHDGDPRRFARVFPPAADPTDVGGVRFVPFVDPEEPGYNARRRARDLGRLAAARHGWTGPIVAVQHVPLLPPGHPACPYNYVNAEEIIACMRENDIGLTLAGHYHPGIDLLEYDGLELVTAPALCEAPFSYLILHLDPAQLKVTRQHLRMPPELGLVDAHVHTELAYCNENMDVPLALRLGEEFGLAGIRVTEHSGHLYFDRAGYGSCARDGLARARPEQRRMEHYLELLEASSCPPAWWGIEIDCCSDGAPLIDSSDLGRLPFRMGAVHQRPGRDPDRPGLSTDDFLWALDRFLPTAGIRVLAHPFRIFRRSGLPLPSGIFPPTVKLLRQHGVAAEINFHTNDPSPEFVRLCIEAGVPLVFGSDAHNLYEVGEFMPHLDLLKQAGYDGDPSDVLLQV